MSKYCFYNTWCMHFRWARDDFFSVKVYLASSPMTFWLHFFMSWWVEIWGQKIHLAKIWEDLEVFLPELAKSLGREQIKYPKLVLLKLSKYDLKVAFNVQNFLNLVLLNSRTVLLITLYLMTSHHFISAYYMPIYISVSLYLQISTYKQLCITTSLHLYISTSLHLWTAHSSLQMHEGRDTRYNRERKWCNSVPCTENSVESTSCKCSVSLQSAKCSV